MKKLVKRLCGWDFGELSRAVVCGGLCFVLWVVGLPVFAQEKDLTINAHSMNYVDSGNYFNAQGSVEVAYKDTKAQSEQINYYSAEKRIYTESGFKLDYQKLDFVGQKLDFNMKKREGRAENVTIAFDNVLLKGKNVNITPDLITLTDSDFTTCGLKSPHYHFSAQNISLYPKDGWVVCNWSVLWIDGFQTMFVPIYIYDTKAQDKGQTQQVPYPQFGSNNEDGGFISESVPWYVNQKLNGNLTLNYMTKKGLGEYFDVSYTRDDQNKGFFSFYANPKDPIAIVYKHLYSFGPEMKNTNAFNFDLFKIASFKQYDLTAKLSLNERINYEKISMLPMVTLNLNKTVYKGIEFNGSAGLGYVSEESTGAHLFNTDGILNISYPINSENFGIITPRLNNDARLYSDGTHWLRVVGAIDISKQWNNTVATNIGYSHFFMNRGTSPYKYELYRFVPFDQLTFGFMTGVGITKYGINAIYNLPNFNPQDIDYIAKVGIHCFDVIFTYRAMRGEMNLGFALN